jgi:hypothetical protein
MADYYPLVARAVAGLEKNTGEGRRALYERARTALVGQLRGMSDPALTEAEITRERLALEEAIRKVEAESARRRPDAAKPPEPKAPPAPAPMAGANPDESGMSAADRLRSPTRTRTPPGERRSVTDEGLKGFHDIMAEADGLGEATAQAARSAREVFAATPPPAGQAFDRLEPRVEPEGLRTPVRPAMPRAAEQAARAATQRPQQPAQPFDTPPQPADPRIGLQQRQQPLRQPAADDIDELPRRSRVGLVVAILVVLIIVGLGVAAFWQKERIATLFNAVRAPLQQTQKDAAPVKPKIDDRVGGPTQATPPAQPKEQQQATPAQPTQTQPAPSTGTPAAPVVQRVVLYEEDPNDPQGKRYLGSAIWRTETAPPSPNAAPDMAVRADLEIPERRMTMTFSLRRNTDQAMPASHTIEIMFNLPADFPFGGISNVPGILMKQAEQTRGAPLAGLAVKVTSGYFLVGLSAVESDMQRNLQLLKERPWFDIPIVYNNGRRAILAIEKGTPGDRAFEQAFKAWGQ